MAKELEKRRLTPGEWLKARERWQGMPDPGYDWLVAEIATAFGVQITRQGLRKAAITQGWVKDGSASRPMEPEPRQDGPQAKPKAAKPAQTRAHGAAPPTKVLGRGIVTRQSAAAKQAAREMAADDEADPAPEVAHEVELGDGEKPPGYRGTGRPSKYRPEYDDMLIAHFKVRAVAEREVSGMGGATRIQIVAQEPPTLVDFAEKIGVSIDTLGRWATEVDIDGRPVYPSFAEAYTRARKLLEGVLVQGGVMGVYEGRMVQFTLKNWYGWKDQPEKDVQVNPVSRELLEERFKAIMEASDERMRAMLEERRRLRRERLAEEGQ